LRPSPSVQRQIASGRSEAQAEAQAEVQAEPQAKAQAEALLVMKELQGRV
jgi:hypothetical protein